MSSCVIRFGPRTWNRKAQSKRSRVTLRNPREPVFESFLREAKRNTSPDSKREHESHRVKKKKSKNDDEDVEDVIRLLRGVTTKEEKDEEKQRYVASTPSTITSPASMRKERVERMERVERVERIKKQTSPVKKRPKTHQSKRRKSVGTSREFES